MSKLIEIRGYDAQGAGHFGAPRGKRKHNGVDIVCKPDDQIKCFKEGHVTKIGYPYPPNDTKKGHLRYVEITTRRGERHRYFYVKPCVSLHDRVTTDCVIGTSQKLGDIFKGITEHFHFEIKPPLPSKKFINPLVLFCELNLEVASKQD